MASTKSSTTTRRASSSRKSQGKDEQEVSPARWAGVAFVITAIVAAIVLAMISPSDPGISTPGTAAGATPDAADASPTPEASVLDGEPPTAQPAIVNPLDGKSTSEVIIPVTVEVPKEDLPRDTLRLVILRGNEVLKEKTKPKTPGTFTIEGVGIDPGANELTAVLSSVGGGFGPRSEPVVIVVDEDMAGLEIIAPQNKAKTYEMTVLIEGTAPYWIIAMWLLFATTLNVSLKWLRHRPYLAAILGLVAGPAAYYAGYKLGGVQIPDFVSAMAALAAGWALLMPLLIHLSVRLDTASHQAPGALAQGLDARV